MIPLECLPRLCPVCHDETIIGHGRRRRQCHDDQHECIWVRRGLCEPCGKTFTILPDWLAPAGHYKQSGRAGFAEMVAYLKKHACRTILVEKTDRLYRNLKDWSTLDEQGVTIHFVKENVILGPGSRSAEQLVHGTKVLMARNHSLNLSEETSKGMLEKARSGIYPSYAPVGYRNADGLNGKRILVPQRGHVSNSPSGNFPSCWR